jgi:hypothetical protein
MSVMPMKDAEYVRELRAILTDPRPTGIDIGIDTGFGRDVWVESVDITRGPRGFELEVTFALTVPPESAVPGRGVARVPFDRHWRRLNGYETPAAYAPEVARLVRRAAWRQLSSPERTVARLPGRQAQWQLLLDALAEQGTVREPGPGRVEVTMAAGDVVTVVVSPDEWELVLAEHESYGVGLHLAELIGPRDEDERFVVCYAGDLVRSTREDLPPVRGRAHERLLAEHPDGLYWTGPGGDLRG